MKIIVHACEAVVIVLSHQPRYRVWHTLPIFLASVTIPFYTDAKNVFVCKKKLKADC